ncbi:GntR family transcriptional regulator [Diaminobutyricibacter sp. McL0608]|uniref:GntR family transcriptional regulator n=1 Tax=Leifsonia sp. McL0608 TaxID=3143537 RepID=UPI0031F319DF
MPVPSPDPQSIERRSLREIAADKIKEAIFDHTLEPGENLRDEDLQAWLGMSRTPVREALIELKRLGLVDMEAQRFTRVATSDPKTARYDLQTVGALLGGLILVTVPALDSAATARLVKILDRTDAVLGKGDAAEYAAGTRQLLELLVASCPNPVIVEATQDIVDAKIHRVYLARTEITYDWDELRANYRSLRAAVEAGDAAAAMVALGRAFQL